MHKLSRFSIIVAAGKDGQIGLNNEMPWNVKRDLKFFKETTMNSVVIVGRKTAETLPNLPGRDIKIISRNGKSFQDALQESHGSNKVFVIGGGEVYKEAMEKYLYLCDMIYLTRIPYDSDADTFFHLPHHVSLESKLEFPECTFEEYRVEYSHPEYVYLNAMKDILKRGVEKEDRTGTGTISLHGVNLRFPMYPKVPFITTKRLYIKGVREELLWFLEGNTNSLELEEKGVKIWKGNSSKEFLENRGLEYKEGDIGPGYGFQWIHWGEEYKGCDEDYEGIDQIANIIESLKKDKWSRRHILSAWNVADLHKMALPPCHFAAQWVCRPGANGETIVDCIETQRSGDMFLGIPFNIASYTMLTYYICQQTGYTPGELIMTIGDAHIYKNHVEQVKEQLERTPLPFCEMDYSMKPNGYVSWPAIRADMAI